MAIEWHLTKFQRQSTEHDDETYRNGSQNWSASDEHHVRSVDQMSMRNDSRPRAQQIDVSSVYSSTSRAVYINIYHPHRHNKHSSLCGTDVAGKAPLRHSSLSLSKLGQTHSVTAHAVSDRLICTMYRKFVHEFMIDPTLFSL